MERISIERSKEQVRRDRILFIPHVHSFYMEVIQISKEELEEIIERKLKDALLKALIEMTPFVSDEEQDKIEKIAGKPEDYEEEFEEWNGS